MSLEQLLRKQRRGRRSHHLHFCHRREPHPVCPLPILALRPLWLAFESRWRGSLSCETLPKDPGLKEGPLWALALPRNRVSEKLLLNQDPHVECLVSWGIPMAEETAVLVCLSLSCGYGLWWTTHTQHRWSFGLLVLKWTKHSRSWPWLRRQEIFARIPHKASF